MIPEECGFLKKALLAPGEGSGAVWPWENSFPPDQRPQGPVHTGIHVSVEILGNKAGGRLFCYMNIQE